MIQQATFMNDIQIDKARKAGELVICPYSESNLTPVGYNLSFSRFIVSLRKKAFVKIKHKGNEWFFYLRPHETVLVLTRETIWVSKFIGGTFHSKVSLVTRGLGHVSTTLDPGWNGQLLVPLNNPTREKIKIVIARDDNNVKVFETFLTMVLFRAQEAALNTKSDNKAARIELLEEILEEHKHNKDAEYLRDFIQNLKKSINTMESFIDLNDPTDRMQKIKVFQREHVKMITEMDNEFERINTFSKKTYSRKQMVFMVVTGGIFLCLLVGVIAANFQKNEIFKTIVNNVVPLVTAFVILIIGRVYDKYI